MRKILVFLIACLPVLAFSQGAQVNTQSQKAVGMSGAGSALFTDETSIFYNPGALVQMKGNAIQLGTSGIMYRSAFQQSGSTDFYKTDFKISPPVSLFATFGPKDSWWKAGLGIYTPFGGSVYWGKEWPGKYSLTHLSMRAFYIQPTLSFKITESFSIGGGFIYNIGIVDMGRALPFHSTNSNSGYVGLKGTGTGTGYNVGIYYKLEDEFAISVSYRSKSITKLKGGDAKFEVPESLNQMIPATNKFDSELPLPSSLNVGIAFPLSPKWDMAIDGTFINYSIYKSLTFDFDQNNEQLHSSSPKNYQNAFSGKGGVQFKPNNNLDLRAGVGYVYTPVQSNYVYPETPDNNRAMASAGFTYRFSPKWDITGAYVFQKILSRETTNLHTQLSGTYKTNIHAPGISLTYNW